MDEAMEAKEWEVKEYADLDKYAFVTQRAFDNDFVGYCYREYSDIKIDSGWRFMFGDEDEDYLENPDNSLTKDLSEILVWKPELKKVITARYRSEFEWDNEQEKFVEIIE